MTSVTTKSSKCSSVSGVFSYEDGSGTELAIGNGFLKPSYLTGFWEGPGIKIKRINVSIVLPSVVDRGTFLFTLMKMNNR